MVREEKKTTLRGRRQKSIKLTAMEESSTFLMRKPRSEIPLIYDREKLIAQWSTDTGKKLNDDLVCKDCRDWPMKDDEQDRPLWVTADGQIYCEAFHPDGPAAQEFLSIIAEPVSRPELVHEYQITIFTVYSAISFGLTCDEIVDVLEKMSKNLLDRDLKKTIKFHGSRMGRVKLLLKNQRYFIEAKKSDETLLQEILTHPNVENCLKRRDIIEEIGPSRAVKLDFLQQIHDRDEETIIEKSCFLSCDEGRKVLQVEVWTDHIENVKSACHSLQLPILEEFDFLTDKNPILRDANLVPDCKLHPHQEKALCQMFGNGRARSGIVVLPCGAGKTLTGISAMTTMKKRTLILTSTALAVDQWRREVMRFTTISENDIFILTSERKELLPVDRACILISTYTMLGVSDQRRGEQSEKVMSQVRQVDWGLLIVDEVQLMPAKSFRSVATTVHSQCKLGLTATLVREDDLIYDLQWLIGPKLFEAHWMDLQNTNYLARVQCVEVPCEMTPEFFREYLEITEKTTENKLAKKQNAKQVNHVVYNMRKQDRLASCNPTKLRAVEFLINIHEQRGDKIIVFSDNVYILQKMATRLQRYFISGEVTLQERMQVLHNFISNPKCNCIFLSKVGDNALDIPSANVVIQLSSHFGSRRQEAQRLGRILRPKPRISGEYYNAFFYTLISTHTREVVYSERRQQFLVDQGYAYKVIPDIDKRLAKSDLIFDDEAIHQEILHKIIHDNSTTQLEEEKMETSFDSLFG